MKMVFLLLLYWCHFNSSWLDEDCLEGWWSILACSLVALETDSWCAPPTALWTDEGLGWGWMGCLLFVRPSFFLCGFMPLCLEFAAGFSHWWVLSVSVWSLLLFPPVQAVSSANLCYTFLEHHDHAFLHGARWRRLLWACIRVPFLWRGHPSTAALKQDGLYTGQAGSLEDFFVWHVVLPFDAKDGAQAALVKPLQ